MGDHPVKRKAKAKPKANNAPAARRQAFAALIAQGRTGVDAARSAGFKGSESVLKVTASRLLDRDDVQADLAKLRDASRSDAVATAKELKEFWTTVMRGKVVGNNGDPVPTIADRIKAAELLGKTEALFVDRKKHEGDLVVTVRRGGDAPSALPPKEKG